jgi:hypothetical protein
VRGDLAKSIRRATNGDPVPTPAEAMQEEHRRLLKAFRETEGRDPNPSADPEYWDAFSTIMKMRSGHALDEPGSTPVEKRDTEALADALRKRLDDGPAWLRAVVERDE